MCGRSGSALLLIYGYVGMDYVVVFFFLFDFLILCLLGCGLVFSFKAFRLMGDEDKDLAWAV